MNRILKLYIFTDGINDGLFLNDDSIALNQFTYSASRMGGAPTITGTIYYGRCLDDDWSENVYTEFNGERYFLAQTPTSSFDNTDARYKHQVTFVSERIALEDVYFFDVVANPSDGDKPVSNSSEVTFFGDIVEFVSRLNASLAQSGLEYTAVIDSGVTSEEKLASFSDVTISEALKEIYNLYKVPYYFEGKVIHIGEAPDSDDTVFKYGSKEALISVAKNNANYKIINRATGVGSEENLPYFYPNISPWGESVPLYNQEQRDIAVTDWNKISEYGSQAVLEYKGVNLQPYTLASNEDWSKVTYSHVSNNAYDNGFHQSLYSFVYYGEIPFTAVLGYDTLSLDFHPLYSDSKIDYSVGLEDLSTGSKQTFKGFNDNKVSIKEGQYKITIQAYINGKDVSWYDFEAEVHNDLFFSFTLIQTGINENWAINGQAVTLEQVGLASNRTPVVGDQISFSEPLNYIIPSKNLMPSIYRESLGKERFYNAVNNTYVNNDGEYYIFPHPYVAGKPKEGIIKLEDIKPTIKGMTNAAGSRIDMFLDFAFDTNDNDDFDENGNYLHPYFYGKLKKFNGSNGFNLFDHSIESGPMTISMTSGHCGACNFEIGVDKDSQKNVIQVNDRGELIRDEKGDVVRRGVPQEKQNDTINNEVWIALKKDINTFGFIMPNAQSNYRPTIDDTFVITNIALPQGYITAAEKRLEEEIIKYIFENNIEKFTFNVKLSRVFLAEYPDIRQKLNENSTVWIEYNNKLYFLYVSSYSYKQTDEALPEITIEVTDTLATGSNTLQRLVGEVNQTVAKAITAVNVSNDHKYLSKVTDDVIQGNVTLKKQATFGASAVSENYASDPVSGTGWGLTTDTNGDSVLEVDKLTVRKEAHFNELVINQTKFQRGDVIYSNAGCEVTNVEEYEDFYRCYYDNKGGDAFSGFEVNDQAICQRYDDKYGDIIGYYWRLVVGVGATYVDLSKTDYDGAALPKVGDDLCQLGNRNNESRQSAIIVSPSKGGSIVVYSDINSYSLENKNYVGMGVGDDNRAKLYGYGDMFFGDRELKSDFITYQIPEGSDKPKLVINATVEFGSDSTGLSNLSDWKGLEDTVNNNQIENEKKFEELESDLQDYVDAATKGLQDQIDGVVESYFEKYDPSLDNYPANTWLTDEEKEYHLNDTFTNLESGRSWRWSKENDTYKWVEITDTATAEALRLAGLAQDTADGKRRVFTSQPKESEAYDVGDLWVNATYGEIYNNDILRCKTAKKSGDDFSINHWELASKYTDDTVANEALETANRAVTLVDVFYAISDSATTYPSKTDTDAWDTTPPTWVDGKYIWSYTKTTYANGTNAETDPVNITGAIGATGVGISQIVEQYATTDSPTVLPLESAWSTNRPEWVNGQYIWTRSVIYYTDGREPYTTQPICVTGERGQAGTDAESNYVLDLSNQMATVACDAQGNVIGTLPTTTARVFYGTTLKTDWNFEHQEEGCDATLTQSNGVATITVTSLSANDARVQIAASKKDAPTLNVTFNITKVLQGVKGGDGRGIVSTTISYGISNSSNVQPSEWTPTIPNVDEGKYLWTRTVIDYTSGEDSVSYTYSRQGETGESGTSVTIVSIEYQAGTSPTNPPTGVWSDNVVSVAEGQYLWTKTTFSDGNVAYGVAKQGQKGDTGAAAVIYSIEPSVDKVTRDRDVITPSTITVTQYKTTGNTARTITAEKTIKYQRNGKDGSIQSAGNVATCNIEIDSKSITSVDIYLYDGSTLLDKERVPVLADANALDEIRLTTDKEYSIWFSDVAGFIPTNNNAPAEDWTTEEIKDSHEEDILYNSVDGLAWRYEGGDWVEITDAQTVRALELINEVSNNTNAKNNSLANAWGYNDYDSMIAAATLNGKTLITNGYINTELIETNKLIAKKVAVSKDTTLIEIDTDNIFKVSKILSGDVGDNTPVLQLSDKGLDFLDDSGNITAHFTGSEQAFLNIPTVPSKVRLSEKMITTAQNFTMLDFTNNTGRAAEIEIPQINLACRFYADGELQSFDSTGGISYRFTIASGGNNVVYENEEFEVPDSGWEIYNEYETGLTFVTGHQDFYRTVYSGGKVQVASGDRLNIDVQINYWTISSNVNAYFAARINENTNPLGQSISTLLPVSIDDVIQPLLRSDYYGNGFVLAKDVNNYFALAINESADGGAQMEFRNEGVGFRIAHNTISAWTGEAWTPLDWNKILTLLS